MGLQRGGASWEPLVMELMPRLSTTVPLTGHCVNRWKTLQLPVAQLSEKVRPVRRVGSPPQHAPEKHDQTSVGVVRARWASPATRERRRTGVHRRLQIPPHSPLQETNSCTSLSSFRDNTGLCYWIPPVLPMQWDSVLHLDNSQALEKWLMVSG